MPLENEEPIRLRDVPAMLPRTTPGKPIHFITVWRWSTKGVRGVKLKTQPVGGRRLTYPCWVRQFLAALAAKDGQPEPADTTRKRTRELKSKNDALAAAGF